MLNFKSFSIILYNKIYIINFLISVHLTFCHSNSNVNSNGNSNGNSQVENTSENVGGGFNSRSFSSHQNYQPIISRNNFSHFNDHNINDSNFFDEIHGKKSK